VFVGARDLPSEAEEPAPGDRASGGADRPSAREVADPDERGRAYEAVWAQVSAETRDGPEPGQPADGNDRRSFWDEVPRFQKMWAEHQKDWPEAQRPAVDRTADPNGSYRSDGGFYLSPERHAETVAAFGRAREAEPTLSADVQRVERESRYGAWLEGFEFKLKGEDRFKEKIAERLEGKPDKPSAEILRQVPDAIRYTFCVRGETYYRGYYDIKERLESRGYQMYESRNSWDAAEYKGINTRWVTPEGQRFEIQFHTPESFHAKHHITHGAYQRARNPLTTDDEREELKAFQGEVCSYVQAPEGARNIPDFKKEIS
jgi:hypothetical protein